MADARWRLGRARSLRSRGRGQGAGVRLSRQAEYAEVFRGTAHQVRKFAEYLHPATAKASWLELAQSNLQVPPAGGSRQD